MRFQGNGASICPADSYFFGLISYSHEISYNFVEQ